MPNVVDWESCAKTWHAQLEKAEARVAELEVAIADTLASVARREPPDFDRLVAVMPSACTVEESGQPCGEPVLVGRACYDHAQMGPDGEPVDPRPSEARHCDHGIRMSEVCDVCLISEAPGRRTPPREPRPNEARPACGVPGMFGHPCTLAKDHGDVHSWARTDNPRPDDLERAKRWCARLRLGQSDSDDVSLARLLAEVRAEGIEVGAATPCGHVERSETAVPCTRSHVDDELCEGWERQYQHEIRTLKASIGKSVQDAIDGHITPGHALSRIAAQCFATPTGSEGAK